MRTIVVDGFELGIVNHPKLGTLIYDPRSQIEVPQHSVRVYIYSETRTATVAKSVLNEHSATDAGASPAMSKAHDYLLSLTRLTQTRFAQTRLVYCYRCKRDVNSADYSICGKCLWIECSCGACGCGYPGTCSA